MYDINIITELLAETIGSEEAAKVIEEAINEANLSKKVFYEEEELQKICVQLEKKGGVIKLFSKMIRLPQYRETYFKIALEKEEKQLQQIKTLYEELAKAYEKMAKMQQELIRAEKLSALGKMASIIGHDLRNPLATIKNIAFYFKKYLQTEDPKIKKFVEILDLEVERASKIVNDLLDFSRIKKLNIERTNIVEIIEEITKNLIDSNLDKKFHLRKQYNVSSFVFVDQEKIKRAILNIIQNAIEAIENDGVIEISVLEDSDKVVVSIKDNGKGMDEETKLKAFEPFFTTKTKGMGLGLSIVKEIINLHGGAIEINSELGKGTEVIFSLPKNFSQE